jgi:hypothetical protein
MRKTVAGKTIQRKHVACLAGIFVLEIWRQIMFGLKRNKETERFYLLPGQGGEAYRRKQKFLLKWSIIVGLIVSAVLGVLMYFLDKVNP